MKARPPIQTVLCKHGRQDIMNCPDCRNEYIEARKAVQPLIDEYWENRDSVLDHLFARAYMIGKESSTA